MLKRLSMLMAVVFIAASLCGCIAVMAGVSESAKATKNLNVSYGQALEMAKAAIKTQGIEFKKAVIDENVAEVKGRYANGTTVRINIFKISEAECRIEVRVGAGATGKEGARKIIEAITLP